jgi:hypothetical protein
MIKKIMEKLPNARENHYAEEPQYVDGFRPDIIVQNGNKLEVHEVEVINNKPYTSNVKKVLWIALKGKGSWDELHIITDDGTYFDLEPLAFQCYSLRSEISKLTSKKEELEVKKKVLEDKKKKLEREIKELDKTLKFLQLLKARKVGAIKRMRNDTDYDPIWDKHLLEELRKEIARFSDKNTVADCLGVLKK